MFPLPWRSWFSRRPVTVRRSPRSRVRPRLEALEDRLAPAIFTVTTTADSGTNSLRAAISSANNGDSIQFSIPGSGVQTINLLSALPTLNNTVTIDGTTQPGFSGTPLIELNGASAGSGATGLTVNVGNVTIKDLTINRFSGDGILLEAAAGLDTVQGCYLGTNAAGTAAAGNTLGLVISSSANNTIGGTTALARNVISGDGLWGVLMAGASTATNTIEGNYIGTNASGSAAVANFYDGILVAGGANNNTIGGTATGMGNVISGNGRAGIYLYGSASLNNVFGNLLGTNAAGTSALANAEGVFMANGAANNSIGGAIAGQGNVLSGNSFWGVVIQDAGTSGNLVAGNKIGTNLAGNVVIRNTYDGVVVSLGAGNNTIGSVGEGNVISGNGRAGVYFYNAGSGNFVGANMIGLNVSGTAALANLDGIDMTNASTGEIIGGTVAVVANVISGNGRFGVLMQDAGTTNNTVQGNKIGTDASGTFAVANFYDGVTISLGAGFNTVGGTASGAGNQLSGNGRAGVYLYGVGTTGNVVEGNFIGTNAAGTAALGNAEGIYLAASPTGNTIGGTTSSARNVISGNTMFGIVIQDSGTTNNTVEGNYLGTNAAGTAAVGNFYDGIAVSLGAASNTIGGVIGSGAANLISGNGRAGVYFYSASNNTVEGNTIGMNAADNATLGNANGVEITTGGSGNTIGGTTGVAGNILSGNTADGVFISDVGSTGNKIQGNSISQNTLQGVFITAGAANNLIGSLFSSQGNTILFNGGDGVLIGSDPGRGLTVTAGTGNSVLGNSINVNGGLGIDLGANDGVTLNNSKGHVGPNNYQNFPVLNSAVLSGGGTLVTISGTLSGTGYTSFRIELFASPTADPTGYGEGQNLLGSVYVFTDANGNASFTVTFSITAIQGTKISATATNSLGDTSEFAQDITAA